MAVGPAGKRVSISFGFVRFGTDRGVGVPTALMLALAVTAGVACRTVVPRQYEYDQVIDLALDGSASVSVNGSVAALNVLHGLDLDPRPNARVDRAAIRRFFNSNLASVTRLSTSRRHGRRFVHLRLAVPDIDALSDSAAFPAMSFSLSGRGDEYVYRQHVGDPPGDADAGAWPEAGLVAFRVHLPSRIRYHNSPSREVERGNIVGWEQGLAQRLAGEPVDIEVRTETASILYTTLGLFATMAAVVAAMFVLIIWMLVRKGRRQSEA
jgi:hypothetical protein